MDLAVFGVFKSSLGNEIVLLYLNVLFLLHQIAQGSINLQSGGSSKEIRISAGDGSLIES